MCTGDLKIVENLALRELLERGPKYRERRAVNWEEIEEEVTRTLRELVIEWENREEATRDTLRSWEEEVTASRVEEEVGETEDDREDRQRQ